MANDVIQIGNKIEMRPTSKSMTTEETERTYVSQFLQWEDGNIAVIAVPTYKGHLVPLRLEAVYDLDFFTRNGLYRCKGKIIKRTKTSNNIAVAEVQFVSALEKFQRRQYYRMDCMMNMTYAVLSEEQYELFKEKKLCLSQEQKQIVDKKLESQKLTYEKTMVLDLSGGGMRFNSSVQQIPGTVMMLQISFPEVVRKKVPFLLGRIVSSRKIANKTPEAFYTRIEFTNITSAEQEQIITFIFREERDKRKREADLK